MKQDLVHLKDIHLPESMPWWDVAIGWWLLVLCLLLLMTALFYGLPKMIKQYRLRQQRQTLGREILRELQTIKAKYQQDQQHHAVVVKLSVFLRRICMTVFKGQDVAGLLGEKWSLFLDDVWLAEKPDISFIDQRMIDLLEHAAYRSTLEVSKQGDVQTLLHLTELWSETVIKHHV